MTTRPNLGRQPSQRSVSTTIPSQRPPPHRSLSQQFPPASPTRRGNDGILELTLDGDAAQGKARIGMSRLRVEISNDSNTSEIVTSPVQMSDASPAWRSGLPPRGRQLLHSDVASANILDTQHADDGGIPEQTIIPMPLPVRPIHHAPPLADRSRSSPSTLKKDARPKPYVLEVPAAAPSYSPNGHADFFPWTGNHAEDQFSESIIRSGYYDKSQMTQNEIGSARPTIFPALKHKSGLQTLSSLFTTILAQRRAHGQITSASTFKPPPRVTVTDTKREMWLKDLANPTISLRRLSRSIPHGIRGKVLLDQSLSKNIPIERAVWLAKCVGANELRSFRRKGASGTFAMGGEAKWVRDFTVCVEQFLEGVIASCGGKEFKTKINYAIRLATYFHAEMLLDREHYMEWLISSLESSTEARLPVWLLVTQIYWKDLLQYRRHGRRLSSALLKHLTALRRHVDHDILAPLTDRLEALVKDLISASPDNFVSPSLWPKYRDFILTELDGNDDALSTVLKQIDARNSRLIPRDYTKELSSRRKLLHRLDKSLKDSFTNTLPIQCWELDGDKSMLVKTILQWSTSLYRQGTTKIFVAGRVLRAWSKYGADITGEILKFLDNTGHEKHCSATAFYHLISELSRSEHFSTPRYLQWLIARGGVNGREAVLHQGPFATRLLAELPVHSLSESIYDLRMTLLGRAEYSVHDEEEFVDRCIAFMHKQLLGSRPNDIHVSESPLLEEQLDQDMEQAMASASRTCKSELGLWLRQYVRGQVVQPTGPSQNEWEEDRSKKGVSSFSAANFVTIRRYFELMDDFSMLADVLRIVSSANDPDVLASCSDTLNLHIETFAAIGALNDLFDILMGRLQSLAEHDNTAPRVLLVALLDLASRLSSQELVARQLGQELARSDRKNAADACSPVSDQMAMVEDAEADFTEEIEKVLATGNVIEQATLERLFQRITSRLQEAWDKPPEQQRSCGLLLTRLRTFDIPQFELLMNVWVEHLLYITKRPTLTHVCAPLISFGCLSLHAVITRCLTADQHDQRSIGLPLEALTLLTSPSSPSDVMSDEDAYRFRVKQAQTQTNFPMDLLNLVRQAFESQGQVEKVVQELAKKPELQITLKSLVLQDADAWTETLLHPLICSKNPKAVIAIEASVDSYLPSSRGSITIEDLLDLADDMSLPFCKVKLATMFKVEDKRMENTGEAFPDLYGDLDKAIDCRITEGKTSWTSIIPLFDHSVARHLRKGAESRFLSLLPTPRTATGMDIATAQNRIVTAENLFCIIDATSHINSDSAANTNLIADMAVSLNGLWLLLANSQSREIKDSVLAKWLPLMLSFIIIQAPTLDAGRAGQESRAKMTLALIAIFLHVQRQDHCSKIADHLAEQCFDVALHLVDGLSEEVRLQCVRNLKESGYTPQIHYLFSFPASSPNDNLVLMQKGVDKKEKLTPFVLRRWEMLGEPTPNVGENDTSLSLTLFGARRG